MSKNIIPAVELPQSWIYKPLGSICEIARGGSPRPIKSYITDSKDGINWIKIGDAPIGGKYIENTEEKIIPEGVKRSRFVKCGDFILSNSMSFGRPYILKIDGCIHDGWLVFSNISKDVDQDYLYYILCSDVVTQQFADAARGAIVQNLNIEKVANIVIPIPPLPEQRRIAAIIEKRLAVVEKAKRAEEEQREGSIRLKSKLYDNVFQKYVDNIMTIDSICTDISDGTHFTPSYVPNGVPFLSVKDLSAGRISFDDCRYITMEEHNKLIKRCKPEYGDVLYTKVGTTGIAKEIDTKIEFSIFVSVALLKLKEGISAKYIEKALNIPYARKQAEFYTQGATNKNLVIRDLKKIKLYCPNIVEQRKILERLDQVDNDCNKLNNAIIEQQSYINALPAAILRKAFRGEL